jgi:hypothetical protein
VKNGYDFSKGECDKYVEDTRTVLLEPDKAKEFTNSESVNKALSTFLKQQQKLNTKTE